ncbi:recombinase family protein [Georgenia sp. SUBG003]|uniref:recombinase family protein n=1 Tax=Georgenia sp. SUBG003 TaxID=1497974 RepID=UPI000694D5E8
MKLLGYVRVDRMGDDDSEQHDTLRGVGVRPSGIFADVAGGTSPASSRPGWRLLLEELRRGDAVVVTELRTFGEDCTDVALTLGALEHMGVTVRAIREGLDTGERPGPTLRALAHLLQRGRSAPNPAAA